MKTSTNSISSDENQDQAFCQTAVSSSSNTLHLTLNKKWFDMISSGEKKEEYRDIKAYWFNRLVFLPKKVVAYFGHTGLNDFVASHICKSVANSVIGFKPFDFIIFKNGYSKNAKTLIFKNAGIKISKGKQEWGANPNEIYFTIALGEEVGRQNCC